MTNITDVATIVSAIIGIIALISGLSCYRRRLRRRRDRPAVNTSSDENEIEVYRDHVETIPLTEIPRPVNSSNTSTQSYMAEVDVSEIQPDDGTELLLRGNLDGTESVCV